MVHAPATMITISNVLAIELCSEVHNVLMAVVYLKCEWMHAHAHAQLAAQ
jgi:hypothetical protein